MRLIDADELVRDIDELSKDAGFYRPIYEGVKNCINAQQTIDAVPVCRCKDCKHYNTIDWDGNVLCGCNLKSGMVDITPDGFCSYGERKDGEGNG